MDGARYLGEAIESVLAQTASDLELIVVDGGSADASRAIITEIAGRDPRVVTLFQPDTGMYDAILNGFAAGTGRYCCWLNSDDKLLPSALATAAEALSQPDVDWVTGIPAYWDPAGNLAWVGRPRMHPQSIIRRGLAHGRAWGFIQQESTFFSRDLLERVPSDAIERIREQRLAGDFLLWLEFSKLTPLRSLPTVLSGFRVHPGNRSRDVDAYYDEIRAAGYPVTNRAVQLALKPLKLLVDMLMAARNRKAIQLLRKRWRG